MFKKILAILIFVIALAGIFLFISKKTSYQNQKSQTASSSSKIDIAASIYPLAYFTEKVGGDLVTVHLITPGATEPHDYAPTPTDIITVGSSKAFVYNGAGIDAWADRIAPELRKKGIPVLKMTDYLGEVSKNTRDPHIWLDPILAKRQIEDIVQLLTGLDQNHESMYKNNAALYLAELIKLDQEYKNGLENCRLKEIISSHDAFSYLGSRYGITIHSIAGFSPEDEPSSAQMAALTELIKQKHIQTVFFENFVSPKLSETLARETRAQIAVLNPIEGLSAEDAHTSKNYDELMRENLVALKKAMLCM